MTQLNVGKVDIIRKDSILLEDVDPNNLPEFKDIIVDKTEKEMILLGRRVTGNNIDNGSGFIHSVQPVIFEEKTHEEFRDESTYFFDPKFRVMSPMDLLAKLLRGLPLMALAMCLLHTVHELYESKKLNVLIDRKSVV